ncbi:Uncharacterised protein [BD1-7 clade bacterium]|uniref:Phosphate ABC transporter substrate-binding protein n=1 Tax=BD1-7 clade bacterium TaxID=2029982 RepID=A0A5S9PKT8_9GAMM|nr:Uncharacterised protein [BD1-7 clade bacterium]CAA0104968.1 Uncharacterised protein [BD1-7 clade bacterium]
MKLSLMKHWLICLVLGTLIAPAYADIAVIKNPANVSRLDEKQVRSAYLGKLKSFNDGEEIRAYDLPPTSKDWNVFVDRVLRKTPSTLNAYWARMLFSSKGKPPRTLDTEEQILHEVANRKNAIGYVNSSIVDESVTVLFIIKD